MDAVIIVAVNSAAFIILLAYVRHKLNQVKEVLQTMKEEYRTLDSMRSERIWVHYHKHTALVAALGLVEKQVVSETTYEKKL